MDFLWNLVIYYFLPLISFVGFLYLFHQSGLLFLLIGAYYCSPHPPPFTPGETLTLKKQSALGSRRRKGLRALVVGGSGGIGRTVLAALASSPEYERVTLLIRKESSSRLPKNLGPKFRLEIIDFDQLDDVIIGGEHDVGFYTLGAYAGFLSEEEYLKLEYVKALSLAALIKRCGVKDIHWVTAIGTAPNSPFLFGKTKFKVEKAVGELGFERAVFYRPGGVLTSDGSGQFGKERIALMNWLDWGRWLTVNGDEMGEVMVHNSLHGGSGRKVDIFKNAHINQYARAMKNAQK